MPDPSANPPPPPPSPRKPNLKAFGGYEIEGELGRGGMGVVYLARQIKLNRRVALKMLTGHYGPDELQRFLAEAETAAGLHHTNIAHIYEVGEHEGAPFFSMEYVEAGSLADRLRKELPSPREAAQLLISVARALHFAHQNSVVHRDMKPGNVLLDPDGVPKVADFGIAKRLKEDTKLTLSGAVIGTPTYMAPEQAKGTSRHVGPGADVYSLGAILYEMLAGRPPFLPEDSETAITVRVLTEDPVSPAWHRPEIPRDLETICMKCLEKEPRDRYASAAAFAEDLRRFLDDETILAKPPTTVVRTIKWVRRHPWKFVTRALLLLFVAGGLLRLAHWVLYEKSRTEYAATVTGVQGGMEPDGRISAADAAKREVSHRLTRRGLRGPITRVEVVNSRGHPAAVRQLFNYDVFPNWLEGIAGMQKPEERVRETTALEFTFVGREVAEVTALDRNRRIIWRTLFDRPGAAANQQVVRARFMDLRGYDIGLVQGASHAEFERDSTGRDVRARFYSSAGQPATNGEGVYGYALERDSAGRIARLVNLGRDGRPAPNRLGVGALGITWDERGQPLRVVYLDAEGRPMLCNGIGGLTNEYDSAGNLLHVRFLDSAGGPANVAEGGWAATDFVRNNRGETIELIRRRLVSDGQLAVFSRMVIERDGNGYALDLRTFGAENQRVRFRHDEVGNIVEEQLVDLNGSPITGPKGWSIRRVSFTETRDPPGWREDETYFDTRGAKTYSQSGHHCTIKVYDQIGQLSTLVNEDHNPARFSYYRYVSAPEFDARGKLRRTVSRFEDKDGNLASKAGLAFTSIESILDEDGREVTEWKLGCDLDVLGAPTFRTDTEWHKTGARKHRVRQACDANREPLGFISNGTAAHFEEEFNQIDRLERIYETGFDEKLVGFSTREAKFNSGELLSVSHRRADGTELSSVNVFIKSLAPEQPKAAELQADDQLLAANDKPVTTAYGWVFAGTFPGGWIEVMREGRRIRIDGFSAGSLGIILEDRAPGLNQ